MAGKGKPGPAPRNVEARIMENIKVSENGCWMWQRSTSSYGYGQMTVSGQRTRHVYRVLWEIRRGPVQEGLELDHLCHSRDPSCTGGNTCRHRRCVNPDHLEPVTRRINVLRGRSIPAAKARQTACPQGHTFDDDNTYRNPSSGARICRTCAYQHGESVNLRGTAKYGRIPPNLRVYEGKVTKDECVNGHSYNENLYVDSRGRRQCRECRRAATIRHRDRKKLLSRAG